jgi:hypothetical protein
MSTTYDCDGLFGYHLKIRWRLFGFFELLYDVMTILFWRNGVHTAERLSGKLSIARSWVLAISRRHLGHTCDVVAPGC